VALTSALCIAASGALVAAIVVVLADRMTRGQEDAHLRDAAAVLIYELGARDEGPEYLAEDETLELASTGVLIALFDGEKRLGGSDQLQWHAPDTCLERGIMRSCARAAGPYTVVTARDATPLREHRHATMLSAVLAVVCATLLGAAIALALARRVVEPLAQLSLRVEQVPSDDPGNADLGAESRLEEVDALRSSLGAALARLGDALAQAQRFARDAAHELRTPLTTILGELELAAERLPEQEQGELQRAQRVARRLSSLVDRLLILVRTRPREVLGGPVDLLEVLEEAYLALPSETRARVQIGTVSACVPGDALLLQAMVGNALDNSLKFSSGTVHVSVCATETDATVCIEDDGPGIAAEERERVFAPFYRTRASRAGDVPGHGIGLALIAHVAELHGGAARFVDCPRGARLEVKLPA